MRREVYKIVAKGIFGYNIVAISRASAILLKGIIVDV